MAHGKTDLQRLGIFQESSYITIGDPYVSQRNKIIPEKNKNLLPLYLQGGYSKSKAANSDGYFGSFERVFDGEGITSFIELRRKWLKENKAKRIGEHEWIPSNGHKNKSGIGSYLGCFQENYQAMDPAKKAIPSVKEGRNFYTSPGKKGTGYGYADVCLNPFITWPSGHTTYEARHRQLAEANEEHQKKVGGRPVFVSTCRSLDAFDNNPWANGDPLAPGGPPNIKFGVASYPKSMQIGPTFLPSSPSKLDGGMKDGTINKFPEYSHEPYNPYNENFVGKRDKTKYVNGEWIPNPCSALVIPQPSVINKNIDLRINNKTRKQKQSVWNLCSNK